MIILGFSNKRAMRRKLGTKGIINWLGELAKEPMLENLLIRGCSLPWPSSFVQAW